MTHGEDSLHSWAAVPAHLSRSLVRMEDLGCAIDPFISMHSAVGSNTYSEGVDCLCQSRSHILNILYNLSVFSAGALTVAVSDATAVLYQSVLLINKRC